MKKVSRNEKNIYTNCHYWNNYWAEEGRKGVEFYFERLLDEYIDWSNIYSYMEIGGSPGSIMAYMNKKHNLMVSTIDFADKSIIETYMAKEKVNDFEVFQNDFLRYDVKESRARYDLVASWGFVEHFSKKMCEEIVKKQTYMVKPGGYLILELPNIRKFIWLIYFLFNRKMLQIHNLRIMDINFLNRLMNINNIEILYSGYYLTMNEQNEYFLNHPAAKNICLSFIKKASRLRVNDNVRKWFSPYIVIIGRKKYADESSE